MICDVTIVAGDLAAALAFYDPVLATLGLGRVAELVDEEEDDAAVEAIAWGSAEAAPRLWVVAGVAVTSGLHLRLTAKSVLEVETFAATAARSGGVVDAAPRRWAVYRSGEFAATVRDPSGNFLEAVAPE